jgi:transposase
MAMTIVENHLLTVTGGIDTHLDFHVAAAVDSNGGVLGVETFDTTTGGYRQLVAWLAGFGTISLIGVEGTGSYGAGLTRHLTDKGIRVVEVDRPNRQARHRAGKTDAVDAIAAARSCAERDRRWCSEVSDRQHRAIRVKRPGFGRGSAY